MNCFSIKKLFIITSLITLFLTGCEKQVCDYCGEEKYCGEYDILGTTRYICDTCLNSPTSGISSNVANSYAAEPLPTAEPTGEVSVNNDSSSDSNQTANDNMNPAQTSGSNIDPGQAADGSTAESTPVQEQDAQGVQSANNDNTDTTSTSAQQSGTNIYLTRDEALSTISASLADSGLSISPDENASATYKVDSNGNPTGISIVFSSSNNGTLAASVTRDSSASDTDYATCCINTALAFLGSTDFSGTGYTLYNTALEHGNYNKDNCRFYYMDDGNSASFDISFK